MSDETMVDATNELHTHLKKIKSGKKFDRFFGEAPFESNVDTLLFFLTAALYHQQPIAFAEFCGISKHAAIGIFTRLLVYGLFTDEDTITTHHRGFSRMSELITTYFVIPGQQEVDAGERPYIAINVENLLLRAKLEKINWATAETLFVDALTLFSDEIHTREEADITADWLEHFAATIRDKFKALNEKQQKILRQALTGGHAEQADRNYYRPTPDDIPHLDKLVDYGLMFRGKLYEDGFHCYYCTEAGAQAVGLTLPND